MRKNYLISFVFIIASAIFISSGSTNNKDAYTLCYDKNLEAFKTSLQSLVSYTETNSLQTATELEHLRSKIEQVRLCMKTMDFWFRYMEPTMYKKINAPLPVEWETEVFEKFEKPYKREGSGLTLAYLYLDEPNPNRDSIVHLINSSVRALETYSADSITNQLKSYHHFFLCNRLFLLNLAAIYTTGFECPDSSAIVPELRSMLHDASKIYEAFNQSFPETPLSQDYILLFRNAYNFADKQPAHFSAFDHFSFIRDYVNPLYAINQKLLLQYHTVSKNLIDYSLNKNVNSIFNKSLYNAQDPKGIFHRVDNAEALAQLDSLGKKLFYDPILSGNNLRSCASCHKSAQYFTDTIAATSIQFDKKNNLSRNSPSLINTQYNHLIMLDGKHNTLQQQITAVVCNPREMGCNEKEALEKILSCKEYKEGFKKLLKYTPQETEISFEHVASAITYYYSKFSHYYSPFDDAMNRTAILDEDARRGFNLFMSKAQCGTCHFVPQFNGVKPPYVSSEFEVLGIPKDSLFKYPDNDSGRYLINPAAETMHAFRTGSIRNAEYTKPYMHNGVFKDLEQVIDFYDAGGGLGKGFKIDNQTLSSDSLKLSKIEKKQLVAFIHSLNEQIIFDTPPQKLPVSLIKKLNERKVNGTY